MVPFRPLSRSIPLIQRASRFSTLTSSSSPSLHRSGFSRALPSGARLQPAATRLLPCTTRSLTTAREKVKVLLVLYDGGQHAKDVSILHVL